MSQERISRSWRRYFAALGPGAIVASLTIGTGELVFSTRAGALFGYRVLGLFSLVLLLKWALVFASARHWVLADAPPLARWRELPGVRGWLPWTLVILALPAFPVWVSFHAGTIGTLAAAITGTSELLHGTAALAWGLLFLSLTLILSFTGGYARLEKIQSAVVALLVLLVLLAWLRLDPRWSEIAENFASLHRLTYPAWAADIEELARRPVWVEAATYAGVIGGSGYDYLAYVSWLRDKHGPRATRRVSPDELKRWVLLDATVSFVTVLVVSMAFVGCGALILGPRHQLPAGGDLVTLQAQFVQVVGPWLRPVYFLGAFLALGGTLYGTMEVAPAVLRQFMEAVRPDKASTWNLRHWGIGWCGGGGLLILAITLVWRWATGADKPFDLVALVTPANLLTGVLACGWMSWLNVWADHRFLPRPERMNLVLIALNVLGGFAFIAIGARAAWDHGGWAGAWILGGSVLAGSMLASLSGRRTRV